MEYLDLALAIAHHLAVFAVVGLLFYEMAVIRPGLGGATLSRLGAIDIAYGIAAVLLLLVGPARVAFGLEGYQFYVFNPVFWGKIAAFALLGLFSIPPTRAIIRWRRAAAKEPGFSPDAGEIAGTRRFLMLEALMLVLIPVLAAAMARGFGL